MCAPASRRSPRVVVAPPPPARAALPGPLLGVRAPGAPLLQDLPAERGEYDGDADGLHRVDRVREEHDGEEDGEELPDGLDGGEDEGAELLDRVEDEELALPACMQ